MEQCRIPEIQNHIIKDWRIRFLLFITSRKTATYVYEMIQRPGVAMKDFFKRARAKTETHVMSLTTALYRSNQTE